MWQWDITKAAGPVKGIWYHAYVIIDIFSRYIVDHTVEAAESAERRRSSRSGADGRRGAAGVALMVVEEQQEWR
jgi:hypothetical protein